MFAIGTLYIFVFELNLGNVSDECSDIAIRDTCVDSGEGWVAAPVAEGCDSNLGVQKGRTVVDVDSVLVHERVPAVTLDKRGYSVSKLSTRAFEKQMTPPPPLQE